MTLVTWTGDPAGVFDHLPGTFRPIAMTPVTAGAQLLINCAPDAQTAIDAATQFAAADMTDGDGTDRLIVTVLRRHPGATWPRARDAAIIWAFTRHAALDWAKQRIRVNAIGLGISPDQPWQRQPAAAPAADAGPATDADIAACVLAMWRWRSMTGQMIRLGA